MCTTKLPHAEKKEIQTASTWYATIPLIAAIKYWLRKKTQERRGLLLTNYCASEFMLSAFLPRHSSFGPRPAGMTPYRARPVSSPTRSLRGATASLAPRASTPTKVKSSESDDEAWDAVFQNIVAFCNVGITFLSRHTYTAEHITESLNLL